MKICVCVKQVPASNETRLDPVTHTVIREGAESILNPFDAFAVEEAVRLKSRFGGHITAFSMGIPAVSGMLRRVIAVGADEAYLLSDRAFAGADTIATARALAAAIAKDGRPDLILCGRMATDGDTAQVPPMLAELLHIPHVSDVTRIESLESGVLTVRRLTDDGYERASVPLPALVTVLKEINVPRLPSIAGILRGEEAEIRMLNREALNVAPEAVGLKGSRTRVVKSERPVLTRACDFLPGTPDEQAEALTKAALAPFLTGRNEPASAAQQPETPQKGANCASGGEEIRAGGLWVFCEAHEGGARDTAFELLGEAARLAPAMGAQAVAVYAGARPDSGVFKALCESGADAVLAVCGESLQNADALTLTGELEALIKKYRPSALLLGATALGRSLAPRLAARLNTGLTADCTFLAVDPETKRLLQTRPAFGGHLMATILCPDARPQMATVRPRVFPRPVRDGVRPCRVIFETPCGAQSPVTLIERIARERGADIGAADILVSIGQGIGGAENIALAGKLAERLGGALSSSRPLVDAEIMPYARQVGQTGKTVAPKIYIALGISGAMQHMAGVAAKTIVAVNTDPDAPIFDYARYGVIADCGDFLRALLERLG